MKPLLRLLAIAAAAAIAMPVSALAQQGAAADEEEIEEVTVTGTRSRPRSVADSPVAIDSFSENQLDLQPVGDMTENLKNLVPSFTATTLTGDASAAVRPVSLRGLPPDETLLLVNSKRRHRGAHIALFGAAMNFGAHPSDMGMLPSISFKRVEVLRDGAASQYGSDAIAGVINFILRDDSEGGKLEAQYGQYYEGESAYKVAGWKGFRLGDSGFLNVSAEWTDNEQLDRGFQRPDAQALIDAGVTGVGADSPYGDGLAQTWGRPENDGVRTAWNLSVPLNDDQELYSFGNYASTYSNYRFFYRPGSTQPPGDSSWHSSLRPIPLDPTDADGDGIPGSDDDPGSAAEFAGNFCWCTLLPAGYTPFLEIRQTDFASVVGVRGEFDNGILYDLSGNFGTNKHEYKLNNSLSPSWGTESQRDFRPGDLKESDRSLNADFSYPINADVNIAFGAEWREEVWQAFVGDEQSWVAGPWAGISQLTNPETGETYDPAPIGSNGRSGFTADAAGKFTRYNTAIYGDLEWDVNENFLLQFALRWEDFSDFGTTTNGKIATRYNVTDRFTLRGAVSTGFRAPTPGQSNQTIVTTTFDVGSGQQTQAGTVPPADPLLEPLGGKPLDPEEANNVSFGFSADISDNFSVTFDWYQIDVDDRIIKTSRIPVSGVPGFEDAPFTIVEFYTNGADTETKGFDIVATYDMDHAGGSNTAISFAFNHNETELSNIDTVPLTGDPGDPSDDSSVISNQTLFNIENNLPENRASVSVMHYRDQWQFTVRSNWYDEAFDERDFPDGDLVKAAMTVDFETRYSFNENLTLIGGANNLFDKFPNETDTRFSNGLQYSRRTPFGYDGGMWYLKGVYEW